jgi:sigma-B regulation protein RsbU (phosphoserine phosphatase)
VLEPAKAVGGDLYDFFLIDDRHLFFVIGDVSDKGVPAALYMAITKALFKHVARSRPLPIHEIMAQVNRQLTDDNPSEMFVTVFACILDLDSGVITYCDGGHEPPLCLRADGTLDPVPKLGGLVLGFSAAYQYESATIRLSPGDALILFTDGLTEATDADNAMFTVERVGAALSGVVPLAPPEAITAILLGAVRRFVGRAPQSDDLTLLVMRWYGPVVAHVARGEATAPAESRARQDAAVVGAGDQVSDLVPVGRRRA